MSENNRSSAVVEPLRRCAQCGKPVVARWRPFCSKRCADLDLGHWLSETYRVASNEEPETDSEAELGDEDSGAR
ncbi:MAG: DNA gyrase inhibitor YacG [Rhodoplanes sp.]|jgi:uncharacterized protein